MIQIYKYLPERCLLKYEILVLLDAYKNRNILGKQSGSSRTPLDFNRFNKLVPQSTLSKALEFAFLGHTIPVTTTGTHLVKPVCPFSQYKTDAHLKAAVLKLYPIRDGGKSPIEILEKQA